jgi:hypothetical protein
MRVPLLEGAKIIFTGALTPSRWHRNRGSVVSTVGRSLDSMRGPYKYKRSPLL